MAAVQPPLGEKYTEMPSSDAAGATGPASPSARSQSGAWERASGEGPGSDEYCEEHPAPTITDNSVIGAARHAIRNIVTTSIHLADRDAFDRDHAISHPGC